MTVIKRIDRSDSYASRAHVTMRHFLGATTETSVQAFIYFSGVLLFFCLTVLSIIANSLFSIPQVEEIRR